MQQISMFDDETIDFPESHEDVKKLYKKYIAEDEKDLEALSPKDIRNGKSYFLYGKKVFELISDKTGRTKLRILQDDGKYITLTADTPDLAVYITGLKEKKREIFRELGTESFGCCNDYERCSDAMKCLHSDNKDYNGCMYRKNLEVGRIFYGKNANVRGLNDADSDL